MSYVGGEVRSYVVSVIGRYHLCDVPPCGVCGRVAKAGVAWIQVAQYVRRFWYV